MKEMHKTHKIYIYELWQDDVEVDYDWINDKPVLGSLVVDMTFVPDPSDKICMVLVVLMTVTGSMIVMKHTMLKITSAVPMIGTNCGLSHVSRK